MGISLRNIRHVALDLDGTVYRGQTLLPATLPFLQTVREIGIGCTFLTNNPSRSSQDYLDHLKHIGIPALPDQLCTSTHATIEFLRLKRPELRRLFVLGTAGLCQDLELAGFELLPDHPDAAPDAVLVGFDQTLTYSRLCRAAWWIHQRKPWFATNPDRVCPTDQPTVLVDCGSICAALETATGTRPEKVFGKPDPAILETILHRHHLSPQNLAMVGDRLYTDMVMARDTGALAVLVLTGESTAADAQTATPPPDLVLPTLGDFGDLLREAHRKTTRA
jgi:NagD protein